MALTAGSLNPTSLAGTEAVAPLVLELTSALESATTSLALLNTGGILGLEKRSAEAQDVATQLASVTTVRQGDLHTFLRIY